MPTRVSARSTAFHGSREVATDPPRVCASAGETTTWVASTASNCRAIWCAAVWAKPTVATSAPMPDTADS